jgi:uncharacterized protein
MIIPFEKINTDTLQGVLEEIVSRDGTDYGYDEVSISKRIEQVENMLKTGKAYLSFDEESETCSLISKEEYLQLKELA